MINKQLSVIKMDYLIIIKMDCLINVGDENELLDNCQQLRLDDLITIGVEI